MYFLCPFDRLEKCSSLSSAQFTHKKEGEEVEAIILTFIQGIDFCEHKRKQKQISKLFSKFANNREKFC